MRRFFPLIMLLFSGSARAAAGAGEALCPQVRVEATTALGFTELEKQLVCGDPKDPPWRNVPRNQARYMLGTFLQARGYYRYSFRDEPAALVATAGEPTLVAVVEGEGIPDEIDLTRYWLPAGNPLTPKLLDQLEGWVKDRLKASGYACPQVRTSADPVGGRITVVAVPGPRLDITAVEEEKVPDLRDGMLRRFDAFAVGELYDDEELQLTVRRTLGKQLLLSTHFTARCAPEGVVVRQKSLPGPPRVARVGVGFNTEQLFLLRGSLRNSRLGPAGSILDLTATASYREQKLAASADWYVLPYPSRFYLHPELDVRREFEPQFESHETSALFAPAMTMDSQMLALSVGGWVGPSLTLVRTLGTADAPGYSRIHSLDGQVDVRSHLHEFYAAAPRTGFRTTANWSLAIKQGSTVTAHRFGWIGEALYNVAGWDPPKLVLGIRSGYATTITGGSREEFEAVPATYRRFLGGSQSVRGFARHALPDNDGALTTFYTGTEARLVSILPYGIEPLLFADVGLTGKKARYLEQPYYLSPGTGVRWQSPIGPMRLTVARGYVRGKRAGEHESQEHGALFFSFGEEF